VKTTTLGGTFGCALVPTADAIFIHSVHYAIWNAKDAKSGHIMVVYA